MMNATALAPAVAALVDLSAALAARDDDALLEALRAAARAADPVDVEEILVQSYLFLGYPAALNGLALWREVSGEPPGAAQDSDEDWAERGERVCRTVYAGQYERLRSNVQRLHPDMERWMVAEGYGKVLGRPATELCVRELCVVACLAVLDVPRQLYSHLRGALHAGSSVDEVDRAVSIALRRARPETARRARETWETVRERAGRDG